ncbi:hypothetical protein [Caldanaerobacter subterraneus]|uniref:Uncharacterized protein n=1 Tax=Caldanaerobacter subterraneus TaxID=911092 RepID=A0A7Y2L5G2_9THEO|nr:hypothetical protein [Caldanaerobacter subterraneus]NNG66153.1 hypothetical protein [Caldanaerobacter subterraneus]
MRPDIKKLFPDWVNSNEYYDLCLSDDVDSLLSCIFLEKIKGYKINYFYDFTNIYSTDKATNKVIAVDVDLTKGKCWGNHVVIEGNKESANLNRVLGISQENYTQKYAGSTLLTILSYYDVDISQLSEEAKMILLCVDSAYLGFYNDNFKEIHKKYIGDILQFPELIEIEERHTKEEFEGLQRKYRLKEKIKINKEGMLDTDIALTELEAVLGIPFKLPSIKFYLRKSFQTDLITQEYYNTIKNFVNIFSLAMIRKDSIKFTFY